MHGVKKAAIILTIIAVAEACPLIGSAFAPGGTTALARLLGWGAPPIPMVAWLLGGLVALAYCALSMNSLPFIRQHAFDLHPIKLLAVPFALVTGLFEELFFRHLLMDALMHRGIAWLAQIAVSSLAFGAVHAVWGLFGGSAVAAAKSMAYTAGLGAALAVTYLLAGRQLAPAAWSHVVINLVIEPWLMLAALELGRQAARSAAIKSA